MFKAPIYASILLILPVNKLYIPIMSDDEYIEDESWINEFYEYNDFYKEPLTTISLQFIYVNLHKEIQHITQTSIKLDKENILLSKTLNNIILERKHVHSTDFRLYKLLCHNITTEPDNVIENKVEPTELREITEIGDIAFKDSINYFHSLNTLYFVYVEEKLVLKEVTTDCTVISLNKGTRRNRFGKHT
jgi:hypothetical protein